MTKFLCCLRVWIGITLAAVLLPSASFAAQTDKRRDAAAVSVPAAGWQAQIVGHATTPSRLVAVDKTRQTLFLFERQSPLRIANEYACTTGQADGDKLVRGDLKTPEGIYFVSQRLASGLDFTKYGNEAYTLNYPNPVDRLRKKTGYGIWIHGRGTPIIPKETQGCVAMNNGDIAVLGKNLLPGTPVALASAVNFSPAPSPQDRTLLASLEKKTVAWAKAWGNRSKAMFDYYDPEAYSMAQGENFSAFRAQKERLFKQLPWIETKVHNVQALQGPGYWVTWFHQDYRAPNLSTQGVRRLYWQRDGRGDLRIVGMEWEPRLDGTLTAALGDAATGHAEANPRSEEDTAPLAQAAKPEKPAQPVTQIAQAQPAATPAAPPKAPEAPVAQAVPAKPVQAAPAIQVAQAPQAAPPAPVKAPEASVKTAPAPAASVATAKPAPGAASPAKPDPAADLEKAAADGAAFIENWRKAWERGDRKEYMACYDKKAVQGERKGADAIESHKRAVWGKAAPKRVKLTNLRIAVTTSGITADMYQDYADKSGFSDKGVKTLRLKRSGASWRIVQEDWSPMTP